MRRTIRQLREQRGWTQVQLANALEVSPSAVYSWEAGKFEPRASQLRKLADVFNVRMDDIELVERQKLAA